MDPVAQFAIDLIEAKMASTSAALGERKAVTLDAATINADLERIVAQIRRRAEDSAYVPPQLAA
jgi:hypothetical protein